MPNSDDHATELRVAKAQNADLEGQNYSARVELERVKHINEELSEKLQSAELQVKAISTEYREKLHQRESEILSLKQKHNEVLEVQSKMALASTATTTLHHSTTMPTLHTAFGSDEHDFNDVISAQHEINQLQSEVQRLGAECRHWKQVAHTKLPQNREDRGDATENENTADLHNRIKELQQSLAQEIDQHQNELASLQNLHAQKLAAISRKQADDQRLLAQVQAQHDEQRHSSDLTKLASLQQEVEQLRLANQKFSSENKTATEKLAEQSSELESLQSQRTSKQEDVSIVETDSSHRWTPGLTASTPSRPQQPGEDVDDSTEMDRDLLLSSFSEVSLRNKQLEEEIQMLQGQVGSYQQEMDEVDLVKSDWMMEKEALEAVLVKLRSRLRAKEEALAVKTQESLMEVEQHRAAIHGGATAEGSTSDVHIEELTHQVELLTHGKSELEQKCHALAVEKNKLITELQDQRTHVMASEEQLSKSSAVHTTQENITELMAKLEAKSSEVSRLTSQLQDQKEEIEELTSQFNESSENLIEKEAEIAELEEKLAASEEVLVTRTRKPSEEEVTDEIQRLRQELKQQKQSTEDLASREKELQEVAQQLKQREEDMKTLEEEKLALETSLEELDTQHQEAMMAVVTTKEKLSKTNEKLKEKVTTLEQQLVNTSGQVNTDNDARVVALEAEISRGQIHVSKLQAERNQHEEKVKDMAVKLEAGAHALNDLHMDRRELESKVKQLKVEAVNVSGKYAEVSQEKRNLEQKYVQLEVQLNLTHEKLQVASTQSQVRSGLQHDLERLRQELTDSQQQSDLHISRVSSMENDISILQEQLAQTNDEKLNLSMTIDETERRWSSQQDELKQTFEERINTLTAQVSVLQSQESDLKKELKKAEEKLQDQAHQYQNYIKELNNAKDMDTSSLEKEHQRLMREAHETGMKISELELKCERIQKEEDEMTDTLMEDQEQISNALSETININAALETENKALQQLNEEQESTMRTLRAELNSLQAAELQPETSLGSPTSAEVPSVSLLKEKLQKELTEKGLQLENYQKEVAMLQESLSRQVKHTNQEVVNSASLTIQQQNTMLQTLEQSMTEKDEELAQALEKLDEAKAQLAELQQKNKAALPQETLQNGDVEEKENDLDTLTDNRSDEIISNQVQRDELQRIMAQKDEVILELRNNNGALLKLLEERSFTLHGNRSLVEIHKLQNEVKGLRMEKEQIMSILNDKTRECSTLKSEVHKLMNVVSAEKTAISKLQKDNQELLRKTGSPAPAAEDPNQDMTREAIKNLSMVIRDKDLEIESLGQKNQTLLQVLQEGSVEGAQVSAAMQERDNLMKQLGIYQKDREQIIVALNQKHQESVTYHNEIQRLTSVKSQEIERKEALEEEYSSLKKQYEDKQQALLKSQNELLNYKQKFIEVDARYKELLHRQAQAVHAQVQQSPPPTPQADRRQEETNTGSDTSAQDEQSTDSSGQQHVSQLNQLLQQRMEEISQANQQLRQLRIDLQEKERDLTEHQRNLVVKDQVIKDKDALIRQRDSFVAEANGRIRQTHEEVRRKELEAVSTKKQMDNLEFQIRGLHTEVSDAKQERDAATERADALVSERQQLAEANARLSAAIGERDLEMNAMREKVATLTAAVREVGAAEKGEVEQMLEDTEAMQKAAQVLQAERDQAYASLQAVQADNTALKQQMALLSEREMKLQREVERLRSHLLSIEDGYTQDALAAEEREKDLRNKLAAAEERAFNSTNAVQNYSVEASRQVESLQEQLCVIAEQRDSTIMQLSTAKETASQYAASLTNLQMVLEQFQREREEQLSLETERYQRNLTQSKSRVQELEQQVTTLQVELDEATNALEAAQRLSEQLDRKEAMMGALKEEVLLREQELKKAEEEIEKLTTSSEAKVDKLIIKNLLLGYFHTPSDKRGEVLTLLGKVLSFSPEEMKQIGANGPSGGWLTGIFRRTLGTMATPPSTPSKASSYFSDRSFSEMFVKFLERESSPQPTMRLPAEAMAREQQEKQQRQKPIFNPFSIPAHSGSPTLATAGQDSHILMKPMADSLPMFSTIVTAKPTQTGGLPQKLSPSPAGSAPSSGRSTPASTSAILKDVLQQ